MSIRDKREPPILSNEELREMFYGKQAEIDNRRKALMAVAKHKCDDCEVSGTDSASCWVIACVVLLGSIGVLYMLVDIGRKCLGRLGL